MKRARVDLEGHLGIQELLDDALRDGHHDGVLGEDRLAALELCHRCPQALGFALLDHELGVKVARATVALAGRAARRQRQKNQPQPRRRSMHHSGRVYAEAQDVD